MAVPNRVLELIDLFDRNRDAYRSGKYKETQLRHEFVDPFFMALGWDVNNENGYAEAYKDVIHEDAIKVGGATKAPDYCFRIGGTRKFFLEAKKPSIDIKGDVHPAYQLRRYAWTAKLPLSILTDFEEFAVYDCRVTPVKTDKASAARKQYITYTDYVDQWDEIASIFSRDAVLKGSFDKYVESTKRKKGSAEVDTAFLKDIESWRETLARNIALRNPKLTQRELNFAVQRTIDRIIFLRICEDRGVEIYGRLMSLLNGDSIYKRLCHLFSQADDRYNSGLFHFRKEKDRPEPPDELTLKLAIDDKPLKDMIRHLYYPDSPYEFSVFPADILGQVYEQFLGKVIRLTPGHRAKVEDKPEVKKAGGVYYTPTYIVDYIVKNTVGKLLGTDSTGRGGSRTRPKTAKRRKKAAPPTPKEVSKLRILDPACGSGSFLLGAYQYLLDWHRDWYTNDGPEKWAKKRPPRVYQGPGGDWRLTTAERKRILLNNIYGVDIDPQAVEVTKLSLLLKVLEGESSETIGRTLELFHERALPDLGNNIKCGNSLIEPDFYDNRQMGLFDEQERYRINAFDWHAEFSSIMKSGGFDVVIGNPPYIRIQRMKEWAPVQVEFFRTAYDAAAVGNYDIYVVFVERGLSLLNASGLLGFICPNKFVKSKYGKALRQILASQHHVSHVVDFGSQQVFLGPTTYTCLLFLSSTPNKSVHVVQVEDLTGWKGGERQREGRVPAERVGTSEWNLMVGPAAKLCQRLSEKNVRLQDVASRIFQGIIPGADKIYTVRILDEKDDFARCYSRALDREVLLESSLLRPLVSGSVVRRFVFESSEARVIYPYLIEHREAFLIPPEQLEKLYPRTFGYFSQTRSTLDKRDRGSAKGPTWYRYIRRQNISLQDSRKLAVPRLVPRLRAAYDAGGSFCLDNVDVGGITLANDNDRLYKVLLGLLNSRLLNFYFVRHTVPFRGGFYSANRQYIENLPLPPSTAAGELDAQHGKLAKLVDRMLSLHEQLAAAKTAHEKAVLQRQIGATDRQIDRMVYELYELTDDEIRIVEGAT